MSTLQLNTAEHLINYGVSIDHRHQKPNDVKRSTFSERQSKFYRTTRAANSSAIIVIVSQKNFIS